MESDIITGFNSLASMIAERVLDNIKKELPKILSDNSSKSMPQLDKKYIRGNKALAEYLGVSPLTVCDWKCKGVLNEAIKSEYGRVIIYDVEKVLQALNHRTLKPGRPKLNVN